MNDNLLDIDNYLNGLMSEADKKAFETKVAADPALAEELKMEKEMRVIYGDEEWLDEDKGILQNEEAVQLKTFFRSEEAATFKNTIAEVISENRTPTKKRSFWFIGIAASIAVLLTVSLFVFKDNTYDDLYAQYINIENIPSLISRGEDNDTLLENAQLFFEDKKYKKAINAFEEYQEKAASVDPLSYIYNGIAHLEIGQYKNAVDQFDQLSASNTLHSKKAYWYKAMVFLKQNDKEKLLEILKSIASKPGNYNAEKAKQLLKEIQ
ncbi:hypothetical protein [Aquimarina sp. 2201CG5-10]|uniref:tetratricopeptide repeat protein n=1 Tax=Aquimarina callyspongiae TaxID=3098150 RepID=UPI002AB50D85|nr:hypothetical protein [Aquimarina sp. 2201CG5-10]MDY8137833.1 hypothetical protein [Aquimarina sp. 2201CG5-10]